MKSKELRREQIVKMAYLCATPEQYEDWRQAARMSKPSLDSWFCTDCTPSYQREMKKKNWCMRPEIRFKKTKDGDIEGYCPPKNVHIVPSVIKIVESDTNVPDGRLRPPKPFGPCALQDQWK